VTLLTLVLLKLAAIALPLLALAWGLRVYPQKRLLVAAIVPATIVWAAFANPLAVAWVAGIDVFFGVLVVGDLLTLPKRGAFTIERQAGRIASLGKSHAVSLVVANQDVRGHSIVLRDGVPQELNPHPAEFTLQMAPHNRSFLRYVLRPNRRGAFVIDRAHVCAVSRFGFWRRLLDYRITTTVNIYPDMQQLSQYAVLARTNRLSLLGVRRTRQIGHEQDFERLRDYTIDDNYKHIDWRATARRCKLTVKDFQLSQSQRIIFLMDCGRMMTNRAAGLSLLDHALNAVLMLGYVALRQGDSVGMICFSDEIHSFVPPRGGMNQMNHLLHASFDRFPRLVESRYDQAFRYLASHCRKRSLVVLVTNVIDEVNSRQIEQYLTSLSGRHLPLGVLLRDRQLFDAVENERSTDEQFWRAAAAADVLAWRHQVLCDLQHHGALALDVFPENMTAPLINRYLEIKSRHLL